MAVRLCRDGCQQSFVWSFGRGNPSVRSLLLSGYFLPDLHSAYLFCIFALAREARWRFLFLCPQASNSPPTPKRGLFRPKWLCKRASFAFSFGPNELLGVAVSQCRLGRVGKLMGRMRLMRRMEMDGQMNTRKRHVRLFRNLSRFCAIWRRGLPRPLRRRGVPRGTKDD